MPQPSAALSPEQVEKIRSTELANALMKLGKGRALSKAERQLIDEAATPPDTPGEWVKTWHELGAALGISRMGMHKVRARHQDACPRPRPNGDHSVTEWRKFFAANKINTRKIDNEPPSEDDELFTVSVADMQKRLLREKIHAQQLENRTLANELVPIMELQDSLSKFMLAIRQDGNLLVSDLANDLEGIDDFHEREAIIEKRWAQHLDLLASCRWLKQKPKKEKPNGKEKTSEAED